MKPDEQNKLYAIAEKLLNAIHINRTVTMAVDFLTQSCSSESVEAIQYSLQLQETMIKEIYEMLDGDKPGAIFPSGSILEGDQKIDKS